MTIAWIPEPMLADFPRSDTHAIFGYGAARRGRLEFPS